MSWKLLPDKKLSMLTQASVLSKESASEIINTYKGHHRLDTTKTNSFSLRSLAMDPVDWIRLYESVTSVILDANLNNYGFKLQGISSLYYVELDEDGFMDWNMELLESHRETNKLSIYINLNDDYEGGKFSVMNPKPTIVTQMVGQMTMFPSFLLSKHDPIKSGVKRMVAGTVTGLSFT